MAGLEEIKPKREFSEAAGKVAIILAIGISASLFLVTAALLTAAMMRFSAGVGEGLSENGVQLLTGWGGGIIGVLGSYLGYTLGKKEGEKNGTVINNVVPKPNPPKPPEVPK